MSETGQTRPRDDLDEPMDANVSGSNDLLSDADESIGADDERRTQADRRTKTDRRANQDRRTGLDRREGWDRRRGPGRRRCDDRRAAEEGEMTDEQFEFLQAIQNYKKANNRPFPTFTELLEILKALGYRKVAQPQPLNLTQDASHE